MARYTLGGDQVRDELLALYAGLDGIDKTLLCDTHVKIVTTAAVAATAGTPLAEGVLCAPLCVTQPVGGLVNARGYRLLAAIVTAGGSITASDTTYATFDIYSRTSAGASQVAIATLLTQTIATNPTNGSGSFAAFQSIPMVLTAANVLIPANGCLTFDVLKVSTGVAVPAGTTITAFLQVV